MLEEMINKKVEQLVIFELGDEEFAVSIEQVREVVEMLSITHIPNMPDFIEGVINLRGNILPIIDLVKRLKLVTNRNSENKTIMWIEINAQQIGMIVDRVTEVIEVSNEDIDFMPFLITSEIEFRYVRGVVKMEELSGRLLILLDLGLILTHKEKVQLNSRMMSEDLLDE